MRWDGALGNLGGGKVDRVDPPDLCLEAKDKGVGLLEAITIAPPSPLIARSEDSTAIAS